MAPQPPSLEMKIQQANCIRELATLIGFSDAAKDANNLLKFLVRSTTTRLTPEEVTKNFEITKNFFVSDEFRAENGLCDFLSRHQNILGLQVLQKMSDYQLFDYKNFENELAYQLKRATRLRGETDSDDECKDRQMMHFIGDLYSSASNNLEGRTSNDDETRRRSIVKIVVDSNSNNLKIVYKDMQVHESGSLYETILVTYYFAIVFRLQYPMTKLFYAFDKLMEQKHSQEEEQS